jgi:uncharacterized protein (TIRG00374 family)
MKRVLWMTVRLAAAAALLYFVLSRAGNLVALKQLLSTFWLLPVLIFAAVGGAVLEVLRLRVLFQSQQLRIPFGYGYRMVAIAAFFSFCLPGGTSGDVMKLYYLASKNKGRGIEIATVLLADRVIAMFALLAIVVSVALFERSLIAQSRVILLLVLTGAAMMGALVIVTALSCSARVRTTRFYAAIVRRAPFSRYLVRISDALLAFRHHWVAVLEAIALSAASHALLAGMFAAAGSVVLPQASAAAVITLSLLGMFANALPITPGGIGVGESAFQALFGLAGYSGGASLLLAWRAGMMSLCALGCLFYVAGLKGESSHFKEPLAAADPSV